MSSHHIIRDEQEPPIFVFAIHNNWQELLELLGWSPILLVSPALKEIFELKQIKIDGYLIEKGEEDKRSETNFMYAENEFDGSLLEWIERKKCTAVNIFAAHALMKNLFFELKGRRLAVPLIFFTEEGKFILKPKSVFKKWYPEKFRIDILNDDIESTENLVRAKEGYLVDKAGFARVEVKGDLVLIKEKWG